MDVRALERQGYTYADVGRLVGRDWRTVKRYIDEGAQPVYRRKRMPPHLDPFKPLIDQWLAEQPKLLSTRATTTAGCAGLVPSAQVIAKLAERHRCCAS